MANINQNPPNQTSIPAFVSFPHLTVSGSPTRSVRLNLAVGSSIEVSPESNSPTLPTTGQIWPPGVPFVS